MARQLISSGSSFESDIGYSRAVVDGDWVFVSGTTGFDYARMTVPEGIEEQARQCLETIRAVLEQADPALLPGRHPTSGYDVQRRPGGPAHAHRDRGDGPQGLGRLSAPVLSAPRAARRRI
jgi:hypothetical protein